MTVEVCPIERWLGLNMQQLLDRIIAIKSGIIPSDISDQEQDIINSDFFWISDEADFMLQLLRTFDLDLSWSTVTANRNPKTTRELLMNPLLMPGFNDCGAHLTNMAFYDVNLRSLKLASSGGDQDITYIVKRLTKDAADLFGVKAGTINQGDIADLIMVDPAQLANYDGEANVIRQHRTEYNHEQLVNRSDGVVPLVMIGGHIAWENDAFSTELATKPMGRLLKASAA
jgi:N-acyl-D-aspartate/D-glutamate deacylase